MIRIDCIIEIEFKMLAGSSIPLTAALNLARFKGGYILYLFMNEWNHSKSSSITTPLATSSHFSC